MKKLSKFILIFIMVIGIFTLAGCGKTEAPKSDNVKEFSNTIAGKLAKQFYDEIKDNKDLEKIANKLSENEIIEFSVGVEELNEDSYFAGITTEVKGFKKAYAIRPMIGTIPFVAYMFEVDDAEAFEANLKENVDLRWNICTEADTVESVVFENYVFIVLSPNGSE